MNDYFRLIGDIHSNFKSYLRLTRGFEYTLQVGDLFMGRYGFLNELDPDKHKFIGGNHDNYNTIWNYPHNLGNFGTWDIPEFGQIFFVRGAWSIDHKLRTPGLNWWPEEELTPDQGREALELYKEVRPRFVVSHECPISIVEHVSDPIIAYNFGYSRSVIPNKTNQLLQAMAEFHQPDIHVFGHYHVNYDRNHNGTRYVCLPEFGVLDLPKNFLDN